MSGGHEIRLDDKFGQLQPFDIRAEAAAVEPWFNQTLTTVNDAVVRLGVLEGEFHWHKHDAEDEFFLVLDGELQIDIEDRDTIVLGPDQAVTIPKSVLHRPRAPERTVVVMVERATVVPTGDV
ncbi:MAG: cupin domain-containing protein [Gaiellaceae bacterium]